ACLVCVHQSDHVGDADDRPDHRPGDRRPWRPAPPLVDQVADADRNYHFQPRLGQRVVKAEFAFWDRLLGHGPLRGWSRGYFLDRATKVNQSPAKSRSTRHASNGRAFTSPLHALKSSDDRSLDQSGDSSLVTRRLAFRTTDITGPGY